MMNVKDFESKLSQLPDDLKPDIETPKINKGQCIYFRGEKMEVDEYKGIGIFDSNKKINLKKFNSK